MRLLDRVKQILLPSWAPPAPPAAAADTRLLDRRLADTRARTQDTFGRARQVDNLTHKLHLEAERNHFGEAINAAMQKRHA